MNAMTIETTTTPDRALPTVTTPSHLLAMAVEQGADLDKLEKLMALQDRWEAGEAKKAFNEAVAAFKKNPPRVSRDKENKQYGSRYSSLANLVNTVNAGLSEHGLSARWDISQEQQISVTCILSHVRGHSERVTLKGPPDTSGAKNSLQQVKSTLTYLKGATFEAVTGVASDEYNLDDDGNGATTSAPDQSVVSEWLEVIADCSTQEEITNRKRECVEAYGMPDKVPAAIRSAFVRRAEAIGK